MDSLDEALIRLLEQHARPSSKELAEKLHTSPATVRRRINKLLEDGVMRIVAVVDHTKLGLPVTAVIALDVDIDKLNSIAHLLFERPEVTWISTTTGRFDIILVGRFAGTAALSDFIQKELAHLEGLRNSETFVCFEVLSWRTQQKLDTPDT